MRIDSTHHRPLAQSLAFLLLACCLAMPLSCSKQEGSQPAKVTDDSSSAAIASDAPPAALGARENAEIPAWKREVLGLAWMAASKIPDRPHVKTRAKLQEQVCGANIELDQVETLTALIDQIPNYRKGVAYADLAYHCLQQDPRAGVAEYLARARAVSENLKLNQTEQQWRRDRIRSHMARAYVAMGAMEEANALAKTVSEAEAGEFIVAKAERLTREQFDIQFEAIQTVLQGQSFEQKKSAVAASVRLHDMFFSDPLVRQLIEADVIGSTKKMPLTLQADLRIRFAENYIAHDQQPAALKLVDDAQKMVAGAAMIARDRIPYLARLSGVRAEAGDVIGAQALHGEALDLYEKSREDTFDIYRAGLMRALAEACVKMQDTAQAMALYLRAVEEGAVNPNSVPCTEDLVATCLSMVRHDIQPEAPLMARLTSIAKGLSRPW